MPEDVKLRRWGNVYGLYPYPIAVQTLAFSLAFDPGDDLEGLKQYLVHDYCPAVVTEEDFDEESVTQLARDIMIAVHQSPGYRTGLGSYDLKRSHEESFEQATADKATHLSETDEAYDGGGLTRQEAEAQETRRERLRRLEREQD